MFCQTICEGKTETYYRDCDGLVSNKVVIETRQVGATALNELDGSLGLDAQAVTALDDMEEVLLLLEQLLLGVEMLEDGSGLLDRGHGWDVVDRGIGGKSVNGGASEILLVFGVQSHL